MLKVFTRIIEGRILADLGEGRFAREQFLETMEAGTLVTPLSDEDVVEGMSRGFVAFEVLAVIAEKVPLIDLIMR